MRLRRLILLFYGVAAITGATQAPTKDTATGQVATSESKITKAKVDEIRQSMILMYGTSAKLQNIQVAGSSAGDSARGTIVKEDKGELSIDTKPCGGPVVMFTKPYTKRKIGDIKCGQKTFDRYEVEQK